MEQLRWRGLLVAAAWAAGCQAIHQPDPHAAHAAPVPPTPSSLVVQGCEETAYVDRRAPAADRELAWILSIASDPERCLTITVGQSVVWNGNFNVHPLDPQGGDTPNPITGTETGAVTFTAPGTFGYLCGVHPSMKGAIQVVPAAPAAVPALGWAARAGLLILLLLLLRDGHRKFEDTWPRRKA
jgi:hypothetical protein